jgi:hypothetical protein
MRSLFTAGVALLVLSKTIVDAAAVHVERMEMAPIEARSSLEERQSPLTCPSSGGNTPTSRHCWAPGFSKSHDTSDTQLKSDTGSFLYRHVYDLAQHWCSGFVQSPNREHYLQP